MINIAPTVGDLLQLINAESHGNIDSDQLFEIYTTAGIRHKVVAVYTEDDILCFDIERVGLDEL